MLTFKHQIFTILNQNICFLFVCLNWKNLIQRSDVSISTTISKQIQSLWVKDLVFDCLCGLGHVTYSLCPSIPHIYNAAIIMRYYINIIHTLQTAGWEHVGWLEER